jgi:hypothetical protein
MRSSTAAWCLRSRRASRSKRSRPNAEPRAYASPANPNASGRRPRRLMSPEDDGWTNSRVHCRRAIDDRGIMPGGCNQDEAMPDCILKSQALPTVKNYTSRVQDPAGRPSEMTISDPLTGSFARKFDAATRWMRRSPIRKSRRPRRVARGGKRISLDSIPVVLGGQVSAPGPAPAGKASPTDPSPACMTLRGNAP